MTNLRPTVSTLGSREVLFKNMKHQIVQLIKNLFSLYQLTLKKSFSHDDAIHVCILELIYKMPYGKVSGNLILPTFVLSIKNGLKEEVEQLPVA